MTESVFRPQPQDDPALRLFCLPFAGGMAAAYRLWPLGLPTGVELIALQLPGRGQRLREAPLRRMAEMAALAYAEFSPWLNRPFAVFGHSMGAVLARELAQLMTALGRPPLHLFVSARAAQPKRDQPMLHKLPERAFLAELDRRYQGVPAELWSHPDVLDLLMPALRADIEALETHRPDPHAPPLSCPITVFGGSRDRTVMREDLEAWQRETTASFRLRVFEGGHFFLEPQRALILADISATLAPHLNANLSTELAP